MTDSIQHDASTAQFFTIVDGVRCILDYRLQGKVMTITHTGVPEAVGGRGIAGALTRFAFDHARSEGWRVVPACSYASVFAQRHPEYADILHA